MSSSRIFSYHLLKEIKILEELYDLNTGKILTRNVFKPRATIGITDFAKMCKSNFTTLSNTSNVAVPSRRLSNHHLEYDSGMSDKNKSSTTFEQDTFTNRFSDRESSI